MTSKPTPRLALAALMAGATGIGFAPLFVRFSEVGPSATAFFRVLFALPFLWWWWHWERKKNPFAAQPQCRKDYLALGLAGLLFAADLSLWHWSLQFTSIANSTLLANCAPIFVTVGARVLWAEKISTRFVLGTVLGLAGALLLVADSFHLSPKHFLGDMIAILAATFYAGYQLSVKFLRRKFSPPTIMAWSGLVSCPAFLLLAVVSKEKLVATQSKGWWVLVGLALISHVGGQTLIAFAFGHLRAGFSSLGLLLQPVVAGLLAWGLLHEPLSGRQMAGGLMVLAGIGIASRDN